MNKLKLKQFTNNLIKELWNSITNKNKNKNKNMKEINIITATLVAIKAMGTNVFSIYNLTESIRKMVNMGDFEIEGGGNVIHDNVKTAFNEILSNGLLDDYFMRSNGIYREYSKTDPASLFTPTPINVPSPVTKSSKMPLSVQGIILSYLDNVGGYATMKQIQSRLKGCGYTCSDLKEFLESVNRIDPLSNGLPDSRVYTK